MMIKIFKQIFVYLLAIPILSLTLLSYAQATDKNAQTPKQHRWEKRGDFIEMLNLTPEQKEQIQKQHSLNRQKWSGLRDSIRAKRLELKQELEKPTIDKGRVDNIVAEIKILMGEQFQQRVDDIISMKQILTPDQFKKLEEGRNKTEGASQKM